jgi:hypothetical protein
MVMLFMDENARKQLLEKGEVVTFRQYAHGEGRDWATDRRRGKKICDIDVKLLGEVNKIADLSPYVDKSGFISLWDWVVAIRKFIGKGEFKGYLFHVKKI